MAKDERDLLDEAIAAVRQGPWSMSSWTPERWQAVGTLLVAREIRELRKLLTVDNAGALRVRVEK